MASVAAGSLSPSSDGSFAGGSCGQGRGARGGHGGAVARRRCGGFSVVRAGGGGGAAVRRQQWWCYGATTTVVVLRCNDGRDMELRGNDGERPWIPLSLSPPLISPRRRGCHCSLPRMAPLPSTDVHGGSTLFTSPWPLLDALHTL